MRTIERQARALTTLDVLVGVDAASNDRSPYTYRMDRGSRRHARASEDHVGYSRI